MLEEPLLIRKSCPRRSGSTCDSQALEGRVEAGKPMVRAEVLEVEEDHQSRMVVVVVGQEVVVRRSRREEREEQQTAAYPCQEGLHLECGRSIGSSVRTWEVGLEASAWERMGSSWPGSVNDDGIGAVRGVWRGICG